MPAVEGLRSPYDKTVGGLHHLGRMIDKVRLKLAGRLPQDFERNYGLSLGLDGQLCGFLGITHSDFAARVAQGGTDEEIAEWAFSRGLRPNRSQAFVWNEHSRKMGLNDRFTPYFEKMKKENGLEHIKASTAFDLIEWDEGRGTANH